MTTDVTLNSYNGDISNMYRDATLISYQGDISNMYRDATLNSYHGDVSNMYRVVTSGVTLPFGAPCSFFCRPPQIFYCLQKKKKKDRHFFFAFSYRLLAPLELFVPLNIFFASTECLVGRVMVHFAALSNDFSFKKL